MGVVFAIVFIIGAAAFALWAILGLLGAIKDRRAKKRAAEDGAVEDKSDDDA